jgi:hypothetical protein
VGYSELAWALLQRGETTGRVIAFLCDDYGLDAKQARAAIVLAEMLPREEAVTPTPRAATSGRSRRGVAAKAAERPLRPDRRARATAD